MKIGFTGSRNGMTTKQFREFKDLIYHLMLLEPVTEFHHGDCQGADFQAAEYIQKKTPIKVIAHPPIKEKHRAFHSSDVILPAKGYLSRNRDIVMETDCLIGAPANFINPRSGTLYTINFATEKGKQPITLLPDGGWTSPGRLNTSALRK